MTYELALLKQFRFGRRSEQPDSRLASLLEESVDADLATIEVELDALQTDSPQRKPRSKPKRPADCLCRFVTFDAICDVLPKLPWNLMSNRRRTWQVHRSSSCQLMDSSCMSLHKTSSIRYCNDRLNAPTKRSVEVATLEWVAWYNHHRLMEPLGYISPAEAEANYYKQPRTEVAELALT